MEKAIREGMIFDSYKELGAFLGEKINYSGKSWQLQKQRWKKSFEYERYIDGKIFISKVYKENKPIFPNKPNSKYQKYIEYLLICFLLNNKDYVKIKESSLVCSLSFCNQHYYDYSACQKIIEENKLMNDADVYYFKRRVNSRINALLERAIKSLMCFGLISYYGTVTDIVDASKNIHEATEQELDLIASCKNEAARQLEIKYSKNIAYYILTNSSKYYSKYYSILRSKGIYKIVNSYDIHYESKERLIQAKEELINYFRRDGKAIAKEFNTMFVECMRKDFDSSMKNYLKKVDQQQMLDVLVGKRPENFTDEYIMHHEFFCDGDSEKFKSKNELLSKKLLKT